MTEFVSPRFRKKHSHRGIGAVALAVAVIASAIAWGEDGIVGSTKSMKAEDPPSANATLPPQLRAIVSTSPLGMVATGSSEATKAAVEVLERGGNAVDAAVTAALVLGVADSDASGIGGATYLILRLASGRTTVIDGTSQTPGFIDFARYREMNNAGRVYGHEMVAVPTTLAVLDLAIQKYGSISLAAALQPAIDLAGNGYPLSQIQIIWTGKYLQEILDASDYLPLLYLNDGQTVGEPGDPICNHDLAQTLRIIARDGVRSFYRGTIADRIEADMVENGGFLRKRDLAMLRIRERPPVRTTYRGLEVVTVPSPGGGETLIEALNILETYPATFLAEDSLTRHQTFIETFRIALADRAGSGAGMLSTGAPGSQHLTKKHARARAQMIVPGAAISTNTLSEHIDPNCLPDSESTTQVSVIDAQGNAVSLTQSLGRSYGAKVATPGLGFPWNSFLEGYKVDKPNCPGFLRPHAPCGSDMSPTIVIRDRQPVLVLGTPGSNRIASIIASVLSNMVDRGMTLTNAIEAPRILWGGGDSINVDIEIAGANTEFLIDAFNRLDYDNPVESTGFPADPVALVDFGGVNAVAFDPTTGTYTGVVDSRRGGLAMGPRVIADHD